MSKIEKMQKMADKIYEKMEALKNVPDKELREKTDEFKMRLKNGETLDDILIDAYATVGEASYRTTGLRPYKVQFIGAIALHEGKVAEMHTGEGKTLVAAMPAYLNALEGKGVHVVTVNEYLAERDAKNIGRIHEFLGLTVGCVTAKTSNVQKKIEYGKDITYITNSELGFDYLRDNMAQTIEQKNQRGFNYCIIDEVDSILIDEARTPLIIAGQGNKATKLYVACNSLVNILIRGEIIKPSKVDILCGEKSIETGDFSIDEKHRTVTLTVDGIKKCEEFFGLENLTEVDNTEIYHNIILALKAHYLMTRDKDYVVQNGEVLIVDESTGRTQQGRRFTDGLHQAIEAKEHVKIQQENLTIASVTYQNFFNKYKKKSGMTGTAYSERKEIKHTYNMKVVKVPTNKPNIRKDLNDRMFLTQKEKFKAVIEEVKKTHATGQPILIGTSSIQDSELLDKLLRAENLPHTVLNAKYHEQEAEIVSHAGEFKSITIATNMAGRGTDILLDEKSRELGGLKVIGTQRHDSVRIDNQLKGRSGRQGDPGESVFYLSFEDELLRLHGSEAMKKVINTFKVKNNECIEDNLINRTIRIAQRRVEDNHYGQRKEVLKYDKVNNQQRELIYSERDAILEKADTKKTMMGMIEDSINRIIDKHSKNKYVSEFEFDDIKSDIESLVYNIPEVLFESNLTKKKLAKTYIDLALEKYNSRILEWPDENIFKNFERSVILKCLDNRWTLHINDLEILRQNISLVSYGQNDPAMVYKLKAFEMFNEMIEEIKKDSVTMFFASRLSPSKMASA